VKVGNVHVGKQDDPFSKLIEILHYLRNGVSLWMKHLRHNEVMSEAVIRDPEIMSGTPVFKGTRVPLQNLFDYLEHGKSLDYFLEGFPTVSRNLAIQALEEAKELLLSNAAAPALR